MESNPWFVPRPEFDELVSMLDTPSDHAIQVVGADGAGKTTLLNLCRERLAETGRPAILVSCRGMVTADDLGAVVVEIAASAGFQMDPIRQRVMSSSAGAVSLREIVHFFREAASQMGRPVLLIDALDETPYPHRLVSGIQEMIVGLRGWSVVVATRPDSFGLGHVQLERLVLGPLPLEWSASIVRVYAADLPEDVIGRIVEAAGARPWLLELLAREAGRDLVSAIRDAPCFTGLFRRLLTDMLAAAPAGSRLPALVDELAIRGGELDVEALARVMALPSAEIVQLVGSGGSPLVVVEFGTVKFVHPAIRDVVLAERIRFVPFPLAGLQFGSEEAERDDLLESTFVTSGSLRTILEQRRSIVVGDRGSGKSALFRTLPAGAEADSTMVRAIDNSGDLLHRVVAKDAWGDTQALRAAWLIVIAAVVAGEISPTAPKPIRKQATALLAALRLVTPPPSWVRRSARLLTKPFRGTKLSFAIGPITLQAELPSDGPRPHGQIDVETFLVDANAYLRAENRQVRVMIDRIDETYKYDRAVQEAVVQALLQAEAHTSLFDAIGLILFLRTDLFEVYNLQEKSKLVSRTLRLDWTEDEWLRVIASRPLANHQLAWLARRMPADADLAARTALTALFPPEIESQPVDRWLVTSLRNGNGVISPRLAVLLLHLARDTADKSEAMTHALPLFSAATLTTAMTRLSELSFDEVINDFKVASTFVLNVRAGRLDTFTTDSVATLFDESEGTRSEQIHLLERLGFLERVVLTTDTGLTSSFRIPPLYTRCWDPVAS